MASCPANLKSSTSSDQLNVKKELSPIFIRNDHQSTSYLNKLQENEGLLHLCVTIKRGTYTFLLTESRKVVAHGKLNVSGWRWQK
uniref:Uncharacterized protein n=1 Tax=Brassica oleracea TaxID=3712 RepID=A0A3P6DB16_BRAOL|nr:unnamed protein product [Brassica oleracea]